MQMESSAHAHGVNPDDPSEEYLDDEEDDYGEEGSHQSFADFANHPYFDQIRDRITSDPTFYNQFM